MATGYPTNFETLREEQNRIHDKSITWITSQVGLYSHLVIFQQSLNMVFDITTEYENPTEQEEVLQYIGLRIFNSCVSAYELMASGYYQVSLSVQRDILEIRHLVDYFTIFPDKIVEWRDCSSVDRYRKFRPALLRDVLDRRDGLRNRKRKMEYDLFCEFAAHASYPGFKLLEKEKQLLLGPFFKEKWLKSCLEELTKQAVLVTRIYIKHFKELPSEFKHPIQDYEISFKKWREEYSHFEKTTITSAD